MCAFVAFCQTQQSPLVLKDPTPRPPDLEKEYGAGADNQARQKQAAALLRNAQIREQVVKATDKLRQLAQELHDDVAKSTTDIYTAQNAGKAAQIQKLAKTIKEKTQMQ
jgi:glucose-6-phosphate-specific signal transduction histidine kinase